MDCTYSQQTSSYRQSFSLSRMGSHTPRNFFHLFCSTGSERRTDDKRSCSAYLGMTGLVHGDGLLAERMEVRRQIRVHAQLNATSTKTAPCISQLSRMMSHACNNSTAVLGHPSTAALLVVDMQNDFVTGSLALSSCPAQQDAREIIAPINKLAASGVFGVVARSRDWHPPNHCSFVTNAEIYAEPSDVRVGPFSVFEQIMLRNDGIAQTLWPPHCIQHTRGAEFAEGIHVSASDLIIDKGMDPAVDSYSAFRDNAQRAKTSLARYVCL